MTGRKGAKNRPFYPKRKENMEEEVLNQSDAIAKLREFCLFIIDKKEEYGDYTAEERADVLSDLMADMDRIEDNNWEWVLFYECPMAPSGINVQEMVKK